MKYNFDQHIDRRHTLSVKWDSFARSGLSEDTLPLWVADMDFPAPPAVSAALEKQSRHGIYGYSEAGEAYSDALIKWYRERHNFTIDPRWIVRTPGVVCAIAQAVRAFSQEGDGVLIQPPVYYPFKNVIVDNRRRVVENPLIYKDGRYSINLDHFATIIKRERPKIFILCSPHNPVGRVWTAEELRAMGKICQDQGVIVIADEIHADFTYPGHSHRVFTELAPDFKDFTILCTAPSKTFNLAGLCASNIIIADEKLRRRFSQELRASATNMVGVMGLLACQVAYAEGAPWLAELKVYLQGNLDYQRRFIEKEMPGMRLVEPEGTYLTWVDFSSLGLPSKELDKLILKKAKVWLDDGPLFGTGGDGFQRFNIACPRATLSQAMERIAAAVKSVSRN